MNLWNFDLIKLYSQSLRFCDHCEAHQFCFWMIILFLIFETFHNAYWIPMETVSCHWVLIWRSMHHFKYPHMPNWSLIELICMKLNQWASASDHLKVRVHNWDHIINSGTSSHSFFGYIGQWCSTFLVFVKPTSTRSLSTSLRPPLPSPLQPPPPAPIHCFGRWMICNL